MLNLSRMVLGCSNEVLNCCKMVLGCSKVVLNCSKMVLSCNNVEPHLSRMVLDCSSLTVVLYSYMLFNMSQKSVSVLRIYKHPSHRSMPKSIHPFKECVNAVYTINFNKKWIKIRKQSLVQSRVHSCNIGLTKLHSPMKQWRFQNHINYRRLILHSKLRYCCTY